eukprot:gene15174-6369_t
MAGSAFVLPQIIVLMNGRILASYGSYALISWSFYIKVIASVTMYIVGPTHIWILGAYMLIDAVLPSAAFSLFNLTVSDIIQEDQRLHNRRLPLSSMVFGLNALVTKPAQSIAPMTVLRILSSFGYQPNAGNVHGALPTGDDFKSAIFGIVCFFPAIIGVVQMTEKKEDTEKKTEDTEKKTEDTEKKTEDTEKKTEDTEKKTEDTEKKTEDAEKKTEDTEKKTEDTEKKTDDTEKKTEDTEKKTEDTEKKMGEKDGRYGEKDGRYGEKDGYFYSQK